MSTVGSVSRAKRFCSLEVYQARLLGVKSNLEFANQSALEISFLMVRMAQRLKEIGEELKKLLPNGAALNDIANAGLDEAVNAAAKAVDGAIQTAAAGKAVPIVGNAIAAAKLVDDLAKKDAQLREAQAIMAKMGAQLNAINEALVTLLRWRRYADFLIDGLFELVVAPFGDCDPPAEDEQANRTGGSGDTVKFDDTGDVIGFGLDRTVRLSFTVGQDGNRESYTVDVPIPDDDQPLAPPLGAVNLGPIQPLVGEYTAPATSAGTAGSGLILNPQAVAPLQTGSAYASPATAAPDLRMGLQTAGTRQVQPAVEPQAAFFHLSQQ